MVEGGLNPDSAVKSEQEATLEQLRQQPKPELVQTVQAVQAVQSPSLILPRDAGEETGEGLNDWNVWNDWNDWNERSSEG